MSAIPNQKLPKVPSTRKFKNTQQRATKPNASKSAAKSVSGQKAGPTRVGKRSGPIVRGR